jgi:two-component system, cell cycle sensor histidine kinase and response regulator CckA
MPVKKARKAKAKSKSVNPHISVRRKASQSKEKMLSFIFDNMVQGVYVIDPEDRIILANKIAVKNTGLSHEKLINSKFSTLGLEFFHEDGSPFAPEKMPLSVVRRTGRAVTNVIMGSSLPKHGIFRWLNVDAVPMLEQGSGTPQFVLFITSDISERMKAEELIRMLMYSINVHRDGLYWLDKDSTIVYINDAACASMGYTREELIGKSIAAINPRANADALQRIWNGVRMQGTYSFETVHRRKDGRDIPIEVRITYLHFRGKEYIIGYGRDISERIRAEQERAKLEDQMRQAQRMESIGRLAGGLAHDFNNLLTAISGHISLALMDLDPMDPLAVSLIEASKATESAANLTRQLLTLSRNPVLNPQTVNLNELVTGIERMIRRLVGDDIKVAAPLRAKSATITADPGQIEQIIINLAINASDAMPVGGKLTLETRAVQIKEGDFSAYSNAKPGRYILLAVRDTGQGISDEVKKHLFEPFYTTKEVGKGTGLGLATVYGAVMQNRGFIEVDSEIGSGTTFRLYFPHVNEKPSAIWKREMDKGDLPKGSETIVLVEDEKIVREMTLKLLRRLGYKVLAYSTGEKTILGLQNSVVPIHLLLTDIILPAMNGRMLANKLTALRPKIKVLFTSGYAENLIARRGVRDQGINFIAKPYSPRDLAKKIREVLDGS